MTTITNNDAVGGSGSLSQSLLSVAVNGLSRAVDGALSKKFPLTAFNERLTYNADGTLRAASAPQGPASASDTLKGILASPVVMAVGIALVIGVLVFAAARAGK